jgi:hypothetical protein
MPRVNDRPPTPERPTIFNRLSATAIALLMLIVGPGCVSWNPFFEAVARLLP